MTFANTTTTLDDAENDSYVDAAVLDQPVAALLVPSPYFHWKPTASRLFAALLLIPGIPIMLLTMLAVRLTSRGPALFRQIRVGKDGKTFTMYKIRTMGQNAEHNTGATWSQADDPRMTPLGRLLRKVHLDEFPQLLNVLRGEMDLIGPRPERPEFTQVLAREIPGYLDRLAILPGITGLAQVNLPPDSDLNSVRLKLALDLQYVKHATLLLDLRMVLCSLLRLMFIPGSWAMRITAVHRPVHLDGWPHDRQPPTGSVPVTPCRIGATASANGNGNGSPHFASGNGHTSAKSVGTAADSAVCKPR